MNQVLSYGVAFAVGLLTNLVTVLLINERDFRKSRASEALRNYKVYWYNTQRIRDRTHQRISCASIAITRDWLYRVRVRFTEECLDEANYEDYTYRGRLYSSETQVHWVMAGFKHAETFYAIFDRTLSRQITCAPGIFLLTSNDSARKPMAIRCVLSRDALTDDDMHERLGGKDYVVVKS